MCPTMLTINNQWNILCTLTLRSLSIHSPLTHPLFTTPLSLIHYSLITRSPLTHYSITTHSKLTHHSLTTHSPLTHHSLTTYSPLIHHLFTTHSPLTHQSECQLGSFVHLAEICRLSLKMVVALSRLLEPKICRGSPNKLSLVACFCPCRPGTEPRPTVVSSYT